MILLTRVIRRIESVEGTRSSFKDMLLGGGITKLEAREVDNLEVTGRGKIHLLVERSMCLSMVIKMGRKVYSNALLRCIFSRNQS
ncbi:hypothetical protein ES319_A03G068000v1 [Gossypium barbadense]|uniref:Uncharacterized protein n=2 Tax=Gossypium TaxID=3633 RepID=A0A5J5WA93_GOSBA|nr:hypothetical protein ES319_A03G068000v1 [Gossypium barbadense]TYH24239.1 hypothetical protein ES288_A03G075900v1 [Gossypium darwinii]